MILTVLNDKYLIHFNNELFNNYGYKLKGKSTSM